LLLDIYFFLWKQQRQSGKYGSDCIVFLVVNRFHLTVFLAQVGDGVLE
jgi:hypothetical protein